MVTRHISRHSWALLATAVLTACAVDDRSSHPTASTTSVEALGKDPATGWSAHDCQLGRGPQTTTAALPPTDTMGVRRFRKEPKSVPTGATTPEASLPLPTPKAEVLEAQREYLRQRAALEKSYSADQTKLEDEAHKLKHALLPVK